MHPLSKETSETHSHTNATSVILHYFMQANLEYVQLKTHNAVKAVECNQCALHPLICECFDQDDDGHHDDIDNNKSGEKYK